MKPKSNRTAAFSRRGLPWLLTIALLGASMTKVNGVMELTISGLGTNNPQTEVNWLGQGNRSGEANQPSHNDQPSGATPKTNANTTPLVDFLNVVIKTCAERVAKIQLAPKYWRSHSLVSRYQAGHRGLHRLKRR